MAGLQQLLIFVFLLFGKISRKCLNDQYLQFWHINCYLLCKNQQFSISNVRGFFANNYILLFLLNMMQNFFFTLFSWWKKKNFFRANFVKVFKEFFFNAKGSIVNLSNKSQKVLLNLLYLLWSYDYDVLIILTTLQFEN